MTDTDDLAGLTQIDWKEFERRAPKALSQIRQLRIVEIFPKTSDPRIGISGCSWKVDGWARTDEGTEFLLECKRWSTQLKPEHVAGIALRAKDLGAFGAIVFNCHKFSRNCARLAAHYNVLQIIVDKNDPEFSFIFDSGGIVATGRHLREHLYRGIGASSLKAEVIKASDQTPTSG